MPHQQVATGAVTALIIVIAGYPLVPPPRGGDDTADQPSVSLTITEQELFGDLFLSVQAASPGEIGKETLEVTIVAQRGGGKCTYVNSRAIWGRESGSVRLDGELGCLQGATFPVDKIKDVKVVIDRGLLSKAKKLACRVTGRRESGKRQYTCT